jgi:hypothetical protein
VDFLSNQFFFFTIINVKLSLKGVDNHSPTRQIQAWREKTQTHTPARWQTLSIFWASCENSVLLASLASVGLNLSTPLYHCSRKLGWWLGIVHFVCIKVPCGVYC